MAVKSYAWSKRLDEAVADTATVEIPTPGFIAPENYKTDEAGVVLDGHVMTDEEASVAWAGDFSSATVTNSSGREWQPAHTLYITVAGTIMSTDDAMAALLALENQVNGLQTQVTALDARVAALEGVSTGFDGRVTAVEGTTTALDGRVTTVEGTATSLGTEVADHEARITALEGATTRSQAKSYSNDEGSKKRR